MLPTFFGLCNFPHACLVIIHYTVWCATKNKLLAMMMVVTRMMRLIAAIAMKRVDETIQGAKRRFSSDRRIHKTTCSMHRTNCWIAFPFQLMILKQATSANPKWCFSPITKSPLGEYELLLFLIPKRHSQDLILDFILVLLLRRRLSTICGGVGAVGEEVVYYHSIQGLKTITNLVLVIW